MGVLIFGESANEPLLCEPAINFAIVRRDLTKDACDCDSVVDLISFANERCVVSSPVG